MSRRDHDLVVVIDFGAQYAQLIARRVREAQVYSEIMPHTAAVAEILARRPKAIILSGGPQSVYAPGAPAGRPGAVRRRRAGLRHLLRLPGDGPGARRDVARPGMQRVRPDDGHGRPIPARCSPGCPPAARVWMCHGDAVAAAPAGFTALAATSASAPVAAFEDVDRRLAGVQWHPEVLHTEAGQQVLEHFLYDIAGCTPDWTPANIVDDAVAGHPAAGRRQAPDLRAVRRGRLRGGRGSGAAGGRQPADLRLRRPRSAAQGRGRAGRARLRRRHRGRPQGGRRRRRSSSPRWPG